MKANDVHTAIRTTIENLTPQGGKISTGDKFRFVTPLAPSSGARAFDIFPVDGPGPSGPTQRGIGTWGANPAAGADEKTVTFGLAVLYPRNEYLRALADADTIWDQVISMRNQYPQIKSVTAVSAPWIGWQGGTEDAMFQAIGFRLDITVRYDARVTS